MPDDTRPDIPVFASEREMLRAFLDYQRATLAMKCDGLGDAELRQRPVPTSALSLLGLVRHLAEVERTWFRRVFTDNDVPLLWSEETDFQAAFDDHDSARAGAFSAWESEVAHSRQVERDAESLDAAGLQPRWGAQVSLRMIMIHVLTEYCRHNGHADFLREATDGVTGA